MFIITLHYDNSRVLVLKCQLLSNQVIFKLNIMTNVWNAFSKYFQYDIVQKISKLFWNLNVISKWTCVYYHEDHEILIYWNQNSRFNNDQNYLSEFHETFIHKFNVSNMLACHTSIVNAVKMSQWQSDIFSERTITLPGDNQNKVEVTRLKTISLTVRSYHKELKDKKQKHWKMKNKSSIYLFLVWMWKITVSQN